SVAMHLARRDRVRALAGDPVQNCGIGPLPRDARGDLGFLPVDARDADVAIASRRPRHGVAIDLRGRGAARTNDDRQPGNAGEPRGRSIGAHHLSGGARRMPRPAIRPMTATSASAPNNSDRVPWRSASVASRTGSPPAIAWRGPPRPKAP